MFTDLFLLLKTVSGEKAMLKKYAFNGSRCVSEAVSKAFGLRTDRGAVGGIGEDELWFSTWAHATLCGALGLPACRPRGTEGPVSAGACPAAPPARPFS